MAARYLVICAAGAGRVPLLRWAPVGLGGTGNQNVPVGSGWNSLLAVSDTTEAAVETASLSGPP